MGETPGTGLDDLAEIVASSGLSSSRLQKSNAPAAQAKAGRGQKKMIMLVSGAGAVIALLLGIIIFMAVRDKASGEKVPRTGRSNISSQQPSGGTIEPVTPKAETKVAPVRAEEEAALSRRSR